MGREVVRSRGFACAILLTMILPIGTGRSEVPQAPATVPDPGLARAFEGNVGQFHPEADTASALDMRIFEEFVDAVKTSSTAVRLVA